MFLDNNGVPLNGGKIYTYTAGSDSSLLTTYTDSTGSVANQNPMILDSSGRPPQAFWLADVSQYHFVVKNSGDTVVWHQDDVSGIQASGGAGLVNSVFGRTGTVTASDGDYILDQIGDVVLTTPLAADLLVFDGTNWVNESTIPGSTITDGSITAVQLANAAVTAIKTNIAAINAASGALNAGVVDVPQLVANAVTSLAIAAGAVSANKTAIAAIDAGTGALASGTVDTAQLVANAVTSVALAAGAVDATKTAIAAINPASGNLTANSVTAGTIATGAVTAGTIAAGTVSASELAANSVVAGKIAANAVTTSTLAAGAVTATAISAGSVTASAMAANSVVAGTIAAGAVIAGNIAAGVVTAVEIQAGSIAGSNIAANTITGSNIAAGTITATNIAANTITAGNIAANTITTDRIIVGAVTAAANGSSGGTLYTGSSVSTLSSGTITSFNLTTTGAPVILGGYVNVQADGNAAMQFMTIELNYYVDGIPVGGNSFMQPIAYNSGGIYYANATLPIGSRVTFLTAGSHAFQYAAQVTFHSSTGSNVTPTTSHMTNTYQMFAQENKV